MSLATRCTSCGTVFRVVQDQLKVSEGWVRCGRCDAVFNALEGLFDLDRDAPPEWTAPPAPAGAAVVDLQVGDADDGPSLERDPSLVDRIDEQIFGARRSAFGALTGIGRSERGGDFADARFDSVPPDEAALVLAPPAAAEAESEPAVMKDAEAPGFVREAERRTRWEGSGARKLLALSALLLAVALVGQVLHQQRDEVAARWPAARTAFQTWCAWTGCELSAPRRIEDLSVESTALTRSGSGSAPDTYRFSVVLRNRAVLPVALPWLELSLTDGNGELVARRALSPGELQATSAHVAAGAEFTFSAQLAAGTMRIAGYTVELFYP